MSPLRSQPKSHTRLLSADRLQRDLPYLETPIDRWMFRSGGPVIRSSVAWVTGLPRCGQAISRSGPSLLGFHLGELRQLCPFFDFVALQRNQLLPRTREHLGDDGLKETLGRAACNARRL
jgi:hypothetical protein